MEDKVVDRCLEQLRQLPFVRRAEVTQAPGDPGWTDLDLRLETGTREVRFAVDVKRTHLTRAIVDGTLARFADPKLGPWMLFAPYVGRRLGEYLAAQQANYVDMAGNCHLRVGPGYHAFVEGRRRPEEARTRETGIRAPGLQVLFAILARPDLLDAPVRTLARFAGVGKSAVAERLQQLREDGYVVEAKNRKRLVRRKTILDQWLAGYENQVRPRLLLGRYQARERQSKRLEQIIENALGDRVAWAWGGGAAAMRLTGHYRGEETVLHVERELSDLPRRIEALPARNGPLTILRIPGPLALEGAEPRTVHPLLVYTELLANHTDRAREAADEVWRHFLESLT